MICFHSFGIRSLTTTDILLSLDWLGLGGLLLVEKLDYGNAKLLDSVHFSYPIRTFPAVAVPVGVLSFWHNKKVQCRQIAYRLFA